MIVDFGFDLAERSEPRLWRGLAFGVGAALVEALLYVGLYRVLIVVFGGNADLWLALEAGLLLLIGNVVLVACKARANVESFGAVYGLVADGRLAVADRLSRLPTGVFTRTRRAVVAELLAGQFGLYQSVVARVWGLAAVNAALPLFLWLLLLVVDWRIALAVALFVILAFLAVPWSHRLLSRASAKLAEQRDDLVAGLLDQIEGARDLHQYDRLARLRQDLQTQLERFEEAQLRTELAPAPALLAFAFLLQLGVALSAVGGALLVARGAAEPSSCFSF